MVKETIYKYILLSIFNIYFTIIAFTYYQLKLIYYKCKVNLEVNRILVKKTANSKTPNHVACILLGRNITQIIQDAVFFVDLCDEQGISKVTLYDKRGFYSYHEFCVVLTFETGDLKANQRDILKKVRASNPIIEFKSEEDGKEAILKLLNICKPSSAFKDISFLDSKLYPAGSSS